MPFADYTDFEDCVDANADKTDPEGYCAVIKRTVEGQSASRDEFDDLSRRRILDVALQHHKDISALAADLPAVCRDCEENTRMQGTFRCPECHPDTSPEEYDGPMATEQAAGDDQDAPPTVEEVLQEAVGDDVDPAALDETPFTAAELDDVAESDPDWTATEAADGRVWVADDPAVAIVDDAD